MRTTLLSILAILFLQHLYAQQPFVVDPMVIEKEVSPGETALVFTIVHNYGPDTLEVMFPDWLERDPPTGFITSVEPVDFLLPPGTQEHVWISWDAEGFEAGTHHQELLCVTNDTSIAPVVIDNVMHVVASAAAGFHGYVTDAASGDPIVECKVRVGEHQVFTNEAGYYEIALEPGVYTVKFIRSGYQTLIVEDTTAMEPFSQLDAQLEGYYFIAGRVWAEDEYVPQSLSYLYKVTEDGTVLDIYADLTGEMGWFEYPELMSAHYMIKAEPNPGSAYFGYYLPTYYGDVLHWEEATMIHLTGSTDDAHIHLVPAAPMAIGPGSITGTLETGAGPAREGFVPIILRLAETGEASMVYTDAEGGFGFHDLAFDTYEIFAEIPGKSVTPRSIILDEANPTADASMMVSGEQIVFLGIEESEYVSRISDVYPNPASGTVSLMVDMKKPAALVAVVVDVLGRVVLSEKTYMASSGIFSADVSGLPAGLYSIRVSDEGSHITVRSFIKD